MLGWFGRKRRESKKTLQRAQSARLNFTPVAYRQLAAVLEGQPRAAALRILVRNPGGASPQYDMALEPASELKAGDTLIDVEGLTVRVDAQSLPLVDGATVDFRDDPLQPGFVVEAPKPRQMEVPDAFDTADPLVAQVESVLEHHVNPGIAAHGGYASLIGVKDDIVYVGLGGGCQGCSMASVTLKQGIEQMLKQAIPRIRAVVDATDHAHGNNPFFTSEKGAESPFHQPAKA